VKILDEFPILPFVLQVFPKLDTERSSHFADFPSLESPGLGKLLSQLAIFRQLSGWIFSGSLSFAVPRSTA
jgi:hypothetical protein